MRACYFVGLFFVRLKMSRGGGREKHLGRVSRVLVLFQDKLLVIQVVVSSSSCPTLEE